MRVSRILRLEPHEQKKVELRPRTELKYQPAMPGGRRSKNRASMGVSVQALGALPAATRMAVLEMVKVIFKNLLFLSDIRWKCTTTPSTGWSRSF